jgi:hypothetical protein
MGQTGAYVLNIRRFESTAAIVAELLRPGESRQIVKVVRVRL